MNALSHGTFRLTAMLAIVTLALGAAGCSGDDGDNGAAGAAGADGLSCWDLNENGVADFPDEDTNDDGVIDVNDCQCCSRPSAAPRSCTRPISPIRPMRTRNPV